jgi:aspartokinase-like uncharacterized kinase
VVKVGGSLLDWPGLPGRLAALLEELRRDRPAARPILIAGGGAAADFVRVLDRVHGLGDPTAHRLAMHTLDLTAMLLAALQPDWLPVDRIEALGPAWDAGRVPVLVPRLILEEIERAGQDPLPPSWDVTSDTIAARIAVHLEAETLILLKSAAPPAGATLEQAARLGWVDPTFPDAARVLPLVESVNLRDPAAKLAPLSPEGPGSRGGDSPLD